ncbi:MAG: topoisomerase DNA-binding C4 zinc finger domain-containing protein, partial [Dethiobacter sp.]|nr:topoisomerase DNA-binding C4 zinc finger domain-containing protein [Dethiobacter sp.]
PGVDFNNNPWNLEQLKIKMKREIEQAARESMQSGTPACPRCAATMSLRTSKRGYRFYACANYPHCREVKGLYE